MNIYILRADNLIANECYDYIIIADSVKQALTSFNGHDGADTDNQILHLYSTMPTANNISYAKPYKLVAIVNGSLNNNNSVKLLALQ